MVVGSSHAGRLVSQSAPMLLQLDRVHFAYAGTTLFRDLSLQVNPGQRMGIVAPNGAGKSTLLRMMAGELRPDQGSVVRPAQVTVKQMQQSHVASSEGTVWDALLQPFHALLALRERLSHLEEQMLQQTDVHALLDTYGTLQETYERQGGYALESTIRQLVTSLGFAEADLQRPLRTLSGGERGRLELASVLLQNPDVLLLDEPTNHLDVTAVEALEQQLLRLHPSKALVVVSHDRYFLQTVCQTTVELSQGKAWVFPGGYEKYLTLRQERYQQQRTAYDQQQIYIAETEEYIRRNQAGQNARQAQGRMKHLAALERIEKPTDVWSEAGTSAVRFDMGAHKGDHEVLRMEKVSIGHHAHAPLVKNWSTVVHRGDRIGLIGPNGAGKSTVVQALLGRLAPLSGQITRGSRTQVAYFDQTLSSVVSNHTAFEEIQDKQPTWNEERIRTHLGAFGFSGDAAFTRVSQLSGGERNRLVLAKLVLTPCQLLVLDEPTNHLDIPTCEVLETALRAFPGTLLIISHDRYLLEKVATRLWILDAERQQMETWHGGYRDWRSHRQAAATQVSTPKSLPAQGARKERVRQQEKAKRRVAVLEQEIQAQEQHLQQLRARLAGSAQPDWQMLAAWTAEEQQVQTLIEKTMGEWEQLQALLPNPFDGE